MIIGNDNRDNIPRQSYAKQSFEQSEIRTPWRGKEDFFGRIHIRFSGCVLDVPKMQSVSNSFRRTKGERSEQDEIYKISARRARR